MIRVYPIPPVLRDNPFLDLLYAPMQATQQVELIRSQPLRKNILEALLGSGPRVAHLHWFDEICQRPGRVETLARTAAFLTLLRLLRARGVRLVWTAHNLAPHEPYQPDLAEQLYRQVIALSDAVIAFSQPVAEALVARYARPRRLHIIPHGHYIGQRGPKPAQAAARAHLGLPTGAFIYLSLGTWRPYKGLEDLIAAFVQWTDDGRRSVVPRPPSVVVIAGQPKLPDYAALLAQMVRNVSGVHLIPGRIPNDAIATYWAAADVAVFPYRRLTNSGGLIEAMSYAVPVIAPDAPAVRELVREGVSGFLFTPGDVGSLAAALARAQAHPDLAAVGQAALDAVRQVEWDDIAAQTVAVYREVISPSHRPVAETVTDG